MEHTAHHSPNGAGHEQSEVSVRLIVVSLAFLAVATLVILLLVVGIFRYFYDVDKTGETQKAVIPPEPRIEVAPYEQYQKLREQEDHIQTTYAYVDKDGGVVRVPISKAIDMLAAKGLPSHNYLDDILAGRKPSTTAAPRANSQAQQGASDAKQ